MSIRRRSIANRLLHWLALPSESEKCRIAEQTLQSPSRMGRYLAYHLKRLENEN